MRAVHERVRGERPGMLDRPGPWWEQRLYDPESERHGAQPLQAVLVPDGYALYAVRSDRDDDGPAGEVNIRELVAATPAARALLWAFLLDQDLTRTITWRLAPPDEPLWLMLTDPDAVRIGLGSALWLRVVDVAAALGARTYARDPDVVLEVSDAFCPWNAGRYRLAGGGCERTDAEPDLALDAAALGAAYLGGDDAARAGGGRARRGSCARARWPARRPRSAAMSRRGVLRSSEAVVRGALAALRCVNCIIEGRVSRRPRAHEAAPATSVF